MWREYNGIVCEVDITSRQFYSSGCLSFLSGIAPRRQCFWWYSRPHGLKRPLQHRLFPLVEGRCRGNGVYEEDFLWWCVTQYVFLTSFQRPWTSPAHPRRLGREESVLRTFCYTGIIMFCTPGSFSCELFYWDLEYTTIYISNFQSNLGFHYFWNLYLYVKYSTFRNTNTCSGYIPELGGSVLVFHI